MNASAERQCVLGLKEHLILNQKTHGFYFGPACQVAEESDFQQANTTSAALASPKQLPPSTCHRYHLWEAERWPQRCPRLNPQSCECMIPPFPDRIKLRTERWKISLGHPEGATQAPGCWEARWGERRGWWHAAGSEWWSLRTEEEVHIKDKGWRDEEKNPQI